MLKSWLTWLSSGLAELMSLVERVPAAARQLRGLARIHQAVCQLTREFPGRLQVVLLDVGRRYLDAEVTLAVATRLYPEPKIAE